MECLVGAVGATVIDDPGHAGLDPLPFGAAYPIMGALVFATYALLAIPLGLIFSSRAMTLRKILRSIGALGFFGLSLGIIWALTRLLF